MAAGPMVGVGRPRRPSARRTATGHRMTRVVFAVLLLARRCCRRPGVRLTAKKPPTPAARLTGPELRQRPRRRRASGTTCSCSARSDPTSGRSTRTPGRRWSGRPRCPGARPARVHTISWLPAKLDIDAAAVRRSSRGRTSGCTRRSANSLRHRPADRGVGAVRGVARVRTTGSWSRRSSWSPGRSATSASTRSARRPGTGTGATASTRSPTWTRSTRGAVPAGVLRQAGHGQPGPPAHALARSDRRPGHARLADPAARAGPVPDRAAGVPRAGRPVRAGDHGVTGPRKEAD